jgi:hypothetical protein
MDNSDIYKLQTDLNNLREWTVEYEMKNPGKSKAVSCGESKVKERIMYYFGDQLIMETSSFKYLGLIICSDLNWANHVNYTVRKTWKALNFIMLILKEGNNTKRLAYTALPRPVLEYGAVCWDP